MANASAIKKLRYAEDAISSLPDEIISQILSCLPTKYAVATSLLARRWRYLYRLTDVLDISGPLTDNYTDGRIMQVCGPFIEFVNKVFVLRSGTPLRKFSLYVTWCGSDYSGLHINVWIKAAMFVGLQELEFSSDFPSSHPLPLSLWNHKQLITLKLSCYEYTEIEYAEPVCLPRLRVLHLQGFALREADFINIFSNSPLLEEVQLSCCLWANGGVNNLCGKALKSLLLEANYENPEHKSTKVVIDAPCLEYFGYHGYLYIDHTLKNLNSIKSAWICLEVISRPDLVMNLISGVANVEVLALSELTLASLEEGKLQGHPVKLPIFNNLLQLGGIGGGWTMFPELLSKSPHLQTLTFLGALKCEENWHPMQELGPFSTNLEKIEVGAFYGFDGEFEWIEYLLQNAKSLKTMIVREATSQSVGEEEIRKKLQKLVKSSREFYIQWN